MKKSKAHPPVEPRKLELPILTAWGERYQESDHGWSKRLGRLTLESGGEIYTTNPERVIIGILLQFVRTLLSSNRIAKSLAMAHFAQFSQPSLVWGFQMQFFKLVFFAQLNICESPSSWISTQIPVSSAQTSILLLPRASLSQDATPAPSLRALFK